MARSTRFDREFGGAARPHRSPSATAVSGARRRSSRSSGANAPCSVREKAHYRNQPAVFPNRLRVRILKPAAFQRGTSRRLSKKPQGTAPARPAGYASRIPIELKLHYRPPYDWNAFLGFIGPRAIPGLEKVDANSYRRNGVEITQCSAKNWLVARIRPDNVKTLRSTAEQIRSTFDLRANTFEIAAHLGKSSPLKTVVKRHPGLRVPGCWDGFELAVRAMLGQQVTVKGATTLAGRLVERFGPPKAEILAKRI